jgi:hypothetical protein
MPASAPMAMPAARRVVFWIFKDRLIPIRIALLKNICAVRALARCAARALERAAAVTVDVTAARPVAARVLPI